MDGLILVGLKVVNAVVGMSSIVGFTEYVERYVENIPSSVDHLL